jgi:hypothetical protein
MEIVTLVANILAALTKLLAANGDKAKEEEALMDAQEVLKAELDRRKFGG